MTRGRQGSRTWRTRHVGLGQARRVATTAALVAALAFLGSGCGSVSTPSATSTTEQPAVRATSAETAFGDTATWENGLQVRISRPAAFTPRDSASFQQASSYLAFKVTIVDGTDENWDPRTFSATLQSGGQEASEVFDSARGLEGAPTWNILVGDREVFKIDYGLADPGDLVMRVTPGFLTVTRIGDMLLGQGEFETVTFTD